MMLSKTAKAEVGAMIPEAAAGHARRSTVSGDQALVKRAQQGDEGAFAALYDTYRRRVYSLCLRMTGDRALAEDLAQEAFMRVFRKLASFRGDSAFSTWLYRLVVNVVLMHLRKKQLAQTSLDETPADAESPAAKHEYGADDARLTGVADRLRLERAIGRLPRGYRAVLILHDIEGYEHAEIARLLDCTTGNCKSQLHKARRRLRGWLRSDLRGKRPRPAAAAVTY